MKLLASIATSRSLMGAAEDPEAVEDEAILLFETWKERKGSCWSFEVKLEIDLLLLVALNADDPLSKYIRRTTSSLDLLPTHYVSTGTQLLAPVDSTSFAPLHAWSFPNQPPCLPPRSTLTRSSTGNPQLGSIHSSTNSRRVSLDTLSQSRPSSSSHELTDSTSLPPFALIRLSDSGRSNEQVFS